MSPAKIQRINITYIAFLASAIIMVVLTFLSFQLFNKQKNATDLVTHTFLVKLKIEEVVTLLKDAETGQRGFLLTKDNAFLEPFDNSKQNIATSIADLQKLVTDNSQQADNVKHLETLVLDRFQYLETGLRLLKNNTPDSLVPVMKKGRVLMDSIKDISITTEQTEDRLLSERYKNKLQADKWTAIYILVFSMISFTVLLFSFFRLRNENVRRTRAEISSEMLEKKINERTKEIADINQQLTDQNDLLEKRNEELNSGKVIASHDLKEPLRKIEMFTSRISELDAQHLSEKSKTYFDGIRTASMRMQNLIEDVLTYAQTNINTDLFKQTDLNKTLQHAMETLNESIAESGAVVNAPNLPVLHAIPEQMEQLFTNLISNALKYSKPGMPPIITISAERMVDKMPDSSISWKLVFTDNGIGFDTKYKDKIFEIFQRLHAKTEYEGTGVGLAICKKIVENHNGSISAISMLGKGSSFTIILPDNSASK